MVQSQNKKTLNMKKTKSIGNPVPITWMSVLLDPHLRYGIVRYVTHSTVLAWRSPWTEEPGGRPSTGSQGADTTEDSTLLIISVLTRWLYHTSVWHGAKPQLPEFAGVCPCGERRLSPSTHPCLHVCVRFCPWAVFSFQLNCWPDRPTCWIQFSWEVDPVCSLSLPMSPHLPQI